MRSVFLWSTVPGCLLQPEMVFFRPHQHSMLEVEERYNANLIGIADGVAETFYAISPEVKLKNHAVIRINEVAHEWRVD